MVILRALLFLSFFASFVLGGPIPLPFLEKHCFECHDEDTKKGGLNLAVLQQQFSDPANFTVWNKVHDAVQSGEMPPKKKGLPDTRESEAFLSALDRALDLEDSARQAQSGRAVLRRLTASEYENTLRDLLSLPELKVRDLLPADGTRHGFDKIGEALDFSHVQLAQYLEAAERALDAAICTQPKAPEPTTYRMYPASSFKFRQALGSGNGVLLQNLQPDPQWPAPGEMNGGKYGEGIRAAEAAGVAKSTSSVALLDRGIEGWYPSTLFAPVHTGHYRLRFSTWSLWWNAGQVEPSKRVETATLFSGPDRQGNFRTLGYFDAPSLTPREHRLELLMGPGDEVIFDAASIFWRGLQVRQLKGGAAAHSGPGVALDWFEASGPFYDQWPTPSHQRLFGNLPITPFDANCGLKPPERSVPRQTRGYASPSATQINQVSNNLKLHSVHSDSPVEDAQRLLSRFLPAAFRRSVNQEEVSQYVRLVEERLAKKDSFELAMRHAYKSILTSPNLLFRSEAPGALSQDALATRLSLWIWNSCPDEELLQLARNGRLRDPGVLKQQLQRLLRDTKGERFIQDFTNQWLKLRDIDATDPDPQLYPEFERFLKESMLQETRLFFRALLMENLPSTQILRSKFLIVNQRLAEHYGLPDVSGNRFRKVELPPGSLRGGFIAQASVLKVTANGTVTNPVLRGAFLNERILGVPIPPPPPGIVAVDPDTRGATTPREQLAKHRVEKCAACHAKIDPPGFALESFDVIGGQRSLYRSVQHGTPSNFKFPDGRGVKFKDGKHVDPSGENANGVSFTNLNEFCSIALQDPDTPARAFLCQMIAYATGAEITYADRREIKRILELTRPEGHRIRSLLEALVESELFGKK